MQEEVVMVELEGCREPRPFDWKLQQHCCPQRLLAAAKQYGLSMDAGPEGSVEVWRDDKGQFRCQFTESHVVDESSISVGDADAAEQWLNQWWPKQYDAVDNDGIG
ncbi:hypothetical protein [Aliagarivorans taiwanensis]|uniref:hypothetical protein n=1 Tax=Aliagarivorans taiwanensis TaxID=561966 RepID=UPI00040FDBF6|nr:hypothetical protein [Aliagarivorans taiwanensis]